MGCDIHLFAEKRVDGKWQSLDKYSKNIHFAPNDNSDWKEPEFEIKREDYFYSGGRNYNLFCALAGVRSFEFSGEPKQVATARGIPSDCCDEIKSEEQRMGSDGHTHSYLYLYELEDFDWSDYGKTCNDFILEVIPKMIITGVAKDDVRIVFWFDN